MLFKDLNLDELKITEDFATFDQIVENINVEKFENDFKELFPSSTNSLVKVSNPQYVGKLFSEVDGKIIHQSLLTNRTIFLRNKIKNEFQKGSLIYDLYDEHSNNNGNETFMKIEIDNVVYNSRLSVTIGEFLTAHNSFKEMLTKFLQHSNNYEKYSHSFNKIIEYISEYNGMIDYVKELREIDGYGNIALDNMCKFEDKYILIVNEYVNNLYDDLQLSFFDYSSSWIEDLSIVNEICCYRWNHSNSDQINFLKEFLTNIFFIKRDFNDFNKMKNHNLLII